VARAATAITEYNINNELGNVSSSQAEGGTANTKQPEGN